MLKFYYRKAAYNVVCILEPYGMTSGVSPGRWAMNLSKNVLLTASVDTGPIKRNPVNPTTAPRS